MSEILLLFFLIMAASADSPRSRLCSVQTHKTEYFVFLYQLIVIRTGELNYIPVKGLFLTQSSLNSVE